MEKRLNRRLLANVDEDNVRLCIQNMLQGEEFLDLTLGMVLFELEDIFKEELIGGIGLIKDILTDERSRRAATGVVMEGEEMEDEEVNEVDNGEEEQQIVNWQAN